MSVDEQAREIFFRLGNCERRPYTRNEYVGRFLWRIVEMSVFRIPWPRRWRIQRRLLRLFGGKVFCQVNRTCRVWHPWLLELGPLSILSHGVTVYNLAQVSVGSHTIISQDVYFCAGTHDHLDPAMPLVRDESAAIKVGSGVWICAGSFICPGVSIGDNSIVAARSVVTKDVPAGVIVGGNPARVIGPRPMGDNLPDLDVQ